MKKSQFMPEQITKTVIASGITINGNITGEGDVEIHGHIVGDVKTANAILLAEGGQVHGKVDCAKINVDGYLQGDVAAKASVEVGKVGVLMGKVTTPRLQLADGAAVQGEVVMPIDEARKRPVSALKPTSIAPRGGTESAEPAATNGARG